MAGVNGSSSWLVWFDRLAAAFIKRTTRWTTAMTMLWQQTTNIWESCSYVYTQFVSKCWRNIRFIKRIPFLAAYDSVTFYHLLTAVSQLFAHSVLPACWTMLLFVTVTACLMHLSTATTSTKWRRSATPTWWRVVYQLFTSAMLRKCHFLRWNFGTRSNNI